MAHHQIFKQPFDPDIDFSGLCQLQIDEDFDIHSSINSILGDELVMAGEAMTKEEDHDKERKRKAMDMMTSTACSSYSSPQQNPNKRRGRGKKGRGKEEEKGAGEVIHVRAKRGQATDSHSLAERVRRGKINERLRCLQDIVPGCYKTMSMAVMLDEIINYVQSLQNQVEFLSMKLTAASSFYDFNADIEAMQRANAFEAIKGENEELPSDSAQPPHNFAYYPQSHTTSGFIN